ncbi:MAG: nucleotide exchange factor GrpE [Thermoplasmata archaeon]|nr:nucleotide exchange factor GrpE [Thermoplasmata archaeon]NIT79985.1 nucleotide exchange factor GrpE [Thermoplasmata archaeon]NIY06353.1 nucleotide exchange factor GrpE [Thermoplasmata archaeon]
MAEKEKPEVEDVGSSPVEEAPVEPTLEELLEQERDRYLRLAAEFDNYRKRTERDMAEFKRRAGDSLLLSVLDVVDNLDRALETSDTCSIEDLVAGLRAIRSQIGTLLDREAVSPIEAMGKEFDPFLMEAVMRVPSDEVDEGHVVSELQRGYRAPERVLRPSKVVVSSGPKVVDEEDK